MVNLLTFFLRVDFWTSTIWSAFGAFLVIAPTLFRDNTSQTSPIGIILFWIMAWVIVIAARFTLFLIHKSKNTETTDLNDLYQNFRKENQFRNW